jgi:hypothetical protein
MPLPDSLLSALLVIPEAPGWAMFVVALVVMCLVASRTLRS